VTESPATATTYPAATAGTYATGGYPSQTGTGGYSTGTETGGYSTGTEYVATGTGEPAPLPDEYPETRR